MVKVAPALPWWERLGHHFSGASGIVVDYDLPGPPSPPGKQRSYGGAKALAPVAPYPSRRLGRPRSNGSRSPRRAVDLQAALQPAAMESIAVEDCVEIQLNQPNLQLPELPVPGPSPKSARSREASTPKSPMSPPRHPLEIMSVDTLTEASIELAILPACNVIVRSHLDDAMRRHKALADNCQMKQKDDLWHLREKQAAWRRQHDALVRRKQSQAAKFRLEKGIGAHLQSKVTTVVEEDSVDMSLAPTRTTTLQEAGDDLVLPVFPEGRATVNSPPSLRATSQASSFGSYPSDKDDELLSAPSPRKSVVEKLIADNRRSGSKESYLAGRRKTSKTPMRKGSEDNYDTARSQETRGYASRTISRKTSVVKDPSKEGDLLLLPDDLSPKKEELAFDACVTLARKHHLRVEDVRKKWDQYRIFDTNGDKNLSMEEFEKVVRLMCRIPDDQPIPGHLTHRLYSETDTNGDGMVSFEEFLLWSNGVQYSEEMMVPDPTERMLREIARQNGLHVVDVERIKATFEKCDLDVTKSIEETQFKNVYCELMNMKSQDISETRLKRYWREVGPPNGGNVSFKDVTVWWHFTCTDNEPPLSRQLSNVGFR